MKSPFMINKDSFFARSAIVCLLLTVLFRFLGTIGHFSDASFLIYRFMLPTVSCILYILCILLFGKKGFWISIVPFIGFVVFFFMKILGNDNINQGNVENLQVAVSIAIYVIVAVVYSGTIFGAIRTKIFLILIFGFAFVYHVVFQDYPAIASKTVSAEAIFMELGVLTILAGLFLTSLGLKKRKAEEPEEVASEPVKEIAEVASDVPGTADVLAETVKTPEEDASAPEEELPEIKEDSCDAVPVIENETIEKIEDTPAEENK